jgi:tetratricopeptide (TPR) repeat protein
MKKNITCLLLVAIIISIFYLSITVSSSQTINVKDYIEDKFPPIFSFYLSSLLDLDSYEKEFIDLLQKLPKEEQEYYAKEVYKNGFSPELIKSIKEGKTIKVPASKPVLPPLPEQKDKKDSDYAYEACGKALYFIDKKEYEKALPYLEIAIKTDISSLKSWAYFYIGFCNDKLETYTKAIEAYMQVIHINPDDAIAHCSLGFAYDQLGIHEEAREACIRAIRIDPDYAEAHYYLGLDYIVFGFRIFAIEAYKQAIRINPDYAEAHYSLGVAYLLIRDRNSAINEYKILKELDIDSANKLFDLIY